MGRRAAIIISVVAATVLSLVLTGGFAWQVNDRRAQVEAADKAAQDYENADRQFRTELVGLTTTQPDGLSKKVADVLANKPELEEVGDYGEENSEEYQDAEELQEDSEDSVEVLQEAADNYEAAMKYGKSARDSLVDPAQYVRNRTKTTSRELRSKALPAVRRARDRFADIDPPAGGEQLRTSVIGALNDVIADVKRLATSFDRGATQGTLNTRLRYLIAGGRITTFESKARSDFASALSEASRPAPV